MKKIILFLMLSIFLISSCDQKQTDIVDGGTPVPPKEQPVPDDPSTETEVEADVKEFKITAKQFAFEPEIIEVSKGDRVRLKVTSVDVPHGISIREYGINERLDVGKEVVIEFTADKEGTFTAFCSVFCGSGHSNMKGKLIVS